MPRSRDFGYRHSRCRLFSNGADGARYKQNETIPEEGSPLRWGHEAKALCVGVLTLTGLEPRPEWQTSRQGPSERQPEGWLDMSRGLAVLCPPPRPGGGCTQGLA